MPVVVHLPVVGRERFDGSDGWDSPSRFRRFHHHTFSFAPYKSQWPLIDPSHTLLIAPWALTAGCRHLMENIDVEHLKPGISNSILWLTNLYPRWVCDWGGSKSFRLLMRNTISKSLALEFGHILHRPKRWYVLTRNCPICCPRVGTLFWSLTTGR